MHLPFNGVHTEVSGRYTQRKGEVQPGGITKLSVAIWHLLVLFTG